MNSLYLEVFDLHSFLLVLQPLIRPVQNFRLDDWRSVGTQFGQQTQRVLPHQLPNQTQSQGLITLMKSLMDFEARISKS